MKYHCQTFRGDDGTLEMYETIISRAKNYPSEVIIDKEERSFSKDGDYTVVLRWWQRDDDTFPSEDEEEDNDNTLKDMITEGGI